MKKLTCGIVFSLLLFLSACSHHRHHGEGCKHEGHGHQKHNGDYHKTHDKGDKQEEVSEKKQTR